MSSTLYLIFHVYTIYSANLIFYSSVDRVQKLCVGQMDNVQLASNRTTDFTPSLVIATVKTIET